MKNITYTKNAKARLKERFMRSEAPQLKPGRKFDCANNRKEESKNVHKK